MTQAMPQAANAALMGQDTAAVRVEKRADGTLILIPTQPLPPARYASFADFLPHWAERRAGNAALCERDAAGGWRRITWREFWRQARSVAAALLEMGLGQDRPVMMLSGNAIEQAVLFMACEYVGIPTAPVSPAYSLMSRDFARLKDVAGLVPPAALFVQSGQVFAPAIAALATHEALVIAVQGAGDGQRSWQDLVATELTPARQAAVAAAHAAIRPEHIARVLFTSGSTGVPKGVATGFAALAFMTRYLDNVFGELTDSEPVYLDWLPWHHAFGLMVNFNRSMLNGATHYIDDGRPLPGQFDKTVRNLREVSPSMFNSVPSAWAMLAGELERDPELARSLCARIHSFGYGGASLPREVWQRVQRVAGQVAGRRIPFHSGLAATETAGSGCFFDGADDDLGNVGVPRPGARIKLLPLEGSDGRYEIRVHSGFPFAGYVKRPDLTAQAFDEEGYFRLGDAALLADPADPAKGLRFAGRVVEDFKLINGTWVRTGAVRLGLLDLCAPLVTDAVICGHDHDYVAALAWPNVAECRRLAPELEGLDAAALATHPVVVQALRDRLRRSSGTASLAVQRLMLMAEPASIDANEISDKGYVNQASTRARRAHLVQALFHPQPGAHVACAR